jgi:hypothetical protein
VLTFSALSVEQKGLVRRVHLAQSFSSPTITSTKIHPTHLKSLATLIRWDIPLFQDLVSDSTSFVRQRVISLDHLRWSSNDCDVVDWIISTCMCCLCGSHACNFQKPLLTFPNLIHEAVDILLSIINPSLIYLSKSKCAWKPHAIYVGRHCTIWKQGEMENWHIWQRSMEMNVLYSVSIYDAMRVVGVTSYSVHMTFGRLMEDALCMPLFDGGNVGIRRRQIQVLMTDAGYDP